MSSKKFKRKKFAKILHRVKNRSKEPPDHLHPLLLCDLEPYFSTYEWPKRETKAQDLEKQLELF